MIGQQFGKLVVLKKGTSTPKNARYLCLCECGNTRAVIATELRSGRVRSCGCANKTGRTITHGHTVGGVFTGTYSSWVAMHSRCRRKNSTSYPWYGGRGIEVCERWLKFENFLDDMGERPDGCSLDRIVLELGYSPLNCKWATREEQDRNRHNSKLYTYQNQTDHLPGWSRTTGVALSTLRKRLSKGWTIAEALETPITRRRSELQNVPR